MTINQNIPREEVNANARVLVIQRMEEILLALRYITYLALAVLSVINEDETLWRIFIVAGTSALSHNVFSHWVFYTRRFSLFCSPWNFLLYLFRFCLLVEITGGPAGPTASLFLFLVIGYHIYNLKTPNTLWITLLVCAAYSFVILTDWLFSKVYEPPLAVYINLFLIAFCGWIMHHLSNHRAPILGSHVAGHIQPHSPSNHCV